MKNGIRAIEDGVGGLKNDINDIFGSLGELHKKMDSMPQLMLDFHDDTIPQRFFIFPEDGNWWDSISIDTLFNKKFRLFFLCEHEKTENNGNVVHQWHLTNHSGYLITDPRGVSHF